MDTHTRSSDRERRLKLVLTVLLLVLVPMAWVGGQFVSWIGDDGLGFDLRYAFLPAAQDVVDGVSPFPRPGDPVLAQQIAYVYPPVVAMAYIPLLTLPESVAVGICVVVSFLLVVALLRLLDIRDWRCYAAGLAWAPVANSAQNAAISIALAFLLALTWRHRGRATLSGGALALAVASKLFLWPVLLWPLLHGRRRAAAVATGGAIALILGSWAVIGFAGLGDYPDLLRELTDLEERSGYSLSGALQEIGTGRAVARAVAAIVVAGLVVLAFRRSRLNDERGAFTAVILAALAGTPILWQHYLAILLVVVAINVPRFGLVWCIPFAAWLSPFVGNGEVWQTLVVPGVAGLVGLLCLVRAAPFTAYPGRPGALRGPSGPRKELVP